MLPIRQKKEAIMPIKPNRRRDRKIHPWVSRRLLAKFDSLIYRLGFTRDGALEQAINDFVVKHGGRRA